MSLFGWLGEWLAPCIHQDRTLATMFDKPEDPKVTTIVLQCDLCGRISKQVVRAEGVAPPCAHKWATYQRNSVFENDNAKRPTHHRINQRCEKCGEERCVDLRPEQRRRGKDDTGTLLK